MSGETNHTGETTVLRKGMLSAAFDAAGRTAPGGDNQDLKNQDREEAARRRNHVSDVEKQQIKTDLERLRGIDQNPDVLGGRRAPLNVSPDKTLSLKKKKERDEKLYRLIRLLKKKGNIDDLLDAAIKLGEDLLEKSKEKIQIYNAYIDGLEQTAARISERVSGTKLAMKEQEFSQNPDGTFKNEPVQNTVEEWKKRTGEDLPDNLTPEMLMVILNDQLTYDTQTWLPEIYAKLEKLYGGVEHEEAHIDTVQDILERLKEIDAMPDGAEKEKALQEFQDEVGKDRLEEIFDQDSTAFDEDEMKLFKDSMELMDDDAKIKVTKDLGLNIDIDGEDLSMQLGEIKPFSPGGP